MHLILLKSLFLLLFSLTPGNYYPFVESTHLFLTQFIPVMLVARIWFHRLLMDAVAQEHFMDLPSIVLFPLQAFSHPFYSSNHKRAFSLTDYHAYKCLFHVTRFQFLSCFVPKILHFSLTFLPGFSQQVFHLHKHPSCSWHIMVRKARLPFALKT